MTVQQAWDRIARFDPIWRRAYANKDWPTCGRCKRLYDRIWARVNRSVGRGGMPESTAANCRAATGC